MNASLRIRRSQVRVLPSAHKKTPQIAGFRFWPHRLRVGLTTYLCEKRLEKRPRDRNDIEVIDPTKEGAHVRAQQPEVRGSR